MDEKEAKRIFVANARRKYGKDHEDRRADIQRAVREAVVNVLAEQKPQPAPPPRFDARTASAAEMAQWRRARGLPDDPVVEWRDPPPLQPSPNFAALKAIEAERLARDRAAELEAGKVDMRTASPERAAARLRQLGADNLILGDLALQRPVPAPMPLNDPDRGNREADEAARRELNAHKRIAASPLKWPIDVRDLSPRAYQLYLRERGLNPDASSPATRDGGK